MEIKLRKDAVAALKLAGLKNKRFLEAYTGWRGMELDVRVLTAKEITLIQNVLKKDKLYDDRDNRRVIRQLAAWEEIQKGDAQEKPVKKLEGLPEIIRALVSPTKHKWLFHSENHYGIPMPWFMEKAKYNPPENRNGYYQPAYVEVSLKAILRGSEKSDTIRIEREDLKKTARDILAGEGYFIESPKMVKDYEASLGKYQADLDRTGEQYLGRGACEERSEEGSWGHKSVSLEKDGVLARLVMDDEEDRGDHSGFTSTKYWEKDYTDDDDEDGEKAWRLPEHPIVRLFHLGSHCFVDTHIDNVERYEYDAKLGEKLVLPPDHKSLIDTLTGDAVERMEDIVKGKASGIIILCSGKPGTGKTLTAEVYSEVAKRPLYTVQCSQLGTDPGALEEHLLTVLRRAMRWRAILLIDEADVYIHERGADLEQNAIVGVFLRVLEYYAGILFLTTNRETITDDAILSRCTAHVRYDVPQGKDRERVWTVLAQQYKVEFTQRELAILLRDFGDISGRSIRQLLRLAKVMADAGKKKPWDMIHFAAKYQDFPERKKGDEE